MNFSYPIKFSGTAVYSPNGKLMAILKGVEVIVYETEELKVYHKFTFNDFANKLEWSPDSTLLLVGLFKRGICEVKSIDNPDWICKIDEGLAGMSFARWSPDSRRIITVSDFNIRMSIWSLIDRSTNYINYPKYSDKGLDFTSNGYFMALAERKESKDYIGIYYVGDWSLVSHFAVDSYDLQDILWSKDNTAIIIWDSSLECKFFIYSPTGNLISCHNPYELNLGIKSLNMSPNGHYLSAGFYDQNVRLYNHISWKLIIDFSHPMNISDTTNINIFREEEVDDTSYSGEGKKTNKCIIYMYNIDVDVQGAVKMPFIKPAMDKPNPSIGVSEISWSFDSNFLATKNDNMPNVLWIWQISSLSLHTVIIQLRPIKHFSWSPTDHMLLICTENSKLYTFTLTNIYIVDLVTDVNYSLSVNKIQWNIDGRSFIVSDKNYMILGHPEMNMDEEHPDNEHEHEEEEHHQENTDMDNNEEYVDNRSSFEK